MTPEILLSAIIFLPAIMALVISFMDGKAVGAIRGVAFGTTAVTFVLTLFLWQQWSQAEAVAAEAAKTPLSLDDISELQDKKTGALIRWAAKAGAILGKSDTAPLGHFASAERL